MSVVEPGRLGDRLSVSRALHPMGVMTLYFTTDFVMGGTEYFSVYRLRTILGSRRGWFDVVELSHSRYSCITALGRPSCLPEEPIHGEWKGAIWRSQIALLHLPVRRVLRLSARDCKGARPSRTSWLGFPGPSQPKLFGKSGHGNLLRRGAQPKRVAMTQLRREGLCL